MSRPTDPLVYDRTQVLIDMAKAGETDPYLFFASGDATLYATGNETYLVFYFNLPSAYYNARDLNRIEDWTAWLATQLDSYGYPCEITPRASRWQMADWPTREEIDRIRANVDALQEGFYALPDWREILYNNTMGWEQANAIEWDLSRIYLWLERMIASFFYSNEVYAGEV